MVTGGSGAVQLTLSAPATVAPGDYIVVITGDDGNNQTSCSVEATVQTGSFTIAADPDWLDVQAGDETGDISTVSLSGLGSFAGNATVTVTSITDASGNAVTSSSGIDCWFTSSGDATSNPLAAGGTDTLNAIAGYDTPEGDYTITLTVADASGNTSTTTLDLEVDAGFELYADPTSLTIPTRGTGASIISAGSFGTPYGSPISLEQPQIFDMNGNPVIDGSVSVSLSQSSINVDDGSTSTATVSASATATVGVYTVLITGADSSGNQTSCWVDATVQTGSFTINADPAWLDTQAGDTTGDSSDITVTGLGSFNGPVTVAVTQITDPSGNDVTTSGAIDAAFSAGRASTSLSVPGDATDTLAVSASASAPQGDYTITLTGADGSGNTSTTQVSVEVDAGFVLDTAPQNLTIAPGGTGISYISALSAGDAMGTPVRLAAAVYDGNGNTVADGSVNVAISPSSVNVGDGTTSTAKVTVGAGATKGATYTVDISGTAAGGNTADTWLNVTAATPGLSLTAAPATASVVAGGSNATCSIIGTPTGGLTGTVSFAATLADQYGNAAPGGLAISINPGSGTADGQNDPMTTVATIQADTTVPNGTYTATITATAGNVSAQTTIQVTVTDTTLTITDQGWMLNGVLDNTPNVGQMITDQLTASISPTPISYVTYTWSEGPVWLSLDDTSANPFAIDAPGDTLLGWQDDAGNQISSPPSDSANPTLTAIFDSAGWYIVEVSCTATVTNPDQSTTTLTASYYIGGYPNQTLAPALTMNSLTPNWTTAGGKKANPHGGSLKILVNDASETSQTIPWLAGQHVVLKAQMSDGSPLGAGRWTLSDTGVPLAGLTVGSGIDGQRKMSANSLASISASALSNPSISFYWIGVGNGIKATWSGVNASGQNVSASVGFNVTKPKVEKITATKFGPVTCSSPGSEYSLKFPITLSPTFATGLYGGKYNWCQILHKYTTAFDFNYILITLRTLSSTQTLDSCYYYNSAAMGLLSAPEDFDDIPQFDYGFAQITAFDFSATTYVMWQAPQTNSLPVPLATVDWGFQSNQSNGTLTYSCTSGPVMNYSVVHEPLWNDILSMK